MSTELNNQVNQVLDELEDPQVTITQNHFDQIQEIYNQLDPRRSDKFVTAILKVLTPDDQTEEEAQYESPKLKKEINLWIQSQLLKRKKHRPVAPPQQ